MASRNMQRITFQARDGHTFAGYRFDPPGSARAGVVIAPGMAILQSFYVSFAQYLAAHGFMVWTFDYRGTGESLAASMRGAKADLTDWYTRDYDAVINAAGDANPGVPLFVVGHSFGGQVVPLVPSCGRLAGVVNIAVGSGARRHTKPHIRRITPLMWHLMAPLLCPVFGYFPGARIGMVGNLPTGAMFQWRRWCLTPDYLLTGQPGAREAYAGATFPVLALIFSDDELLLEEGSRMMHAAYLNNPVDFRVLDPGTFGLKRIGHFGFFKPQHEMSLWPVAMQWMEERCAE